MRRAWGSPRRAPAAHRPGALALAAGVAGIGLLALGGAALVAAAVRKLAEREARAGTLALDELHLRSARGLPPPPG